MNPIAWVLMSATFAQDVDPYLWLEDIDGDTAMNWVKARNAETEAKWASGPDFDARVQRLRSILDSDARIPGITTIGDHVYNFWRDASHERGIWRRTTLDSYRTDDPDWNLVLDLDALAKSESENWVWAGASCLGPHEDRCLVQLSRGGGDATVVREFDLAKKAFVDDGFRLPEAKSDVAWIDRDHLFVMTDRGEGSLTTSGYPRTVVRWARGTELSAAALVYEGEVEDVAVSAWHDDTVGFERDVVLRAPTFFTNEMALLGPDGPRPIEKPSDAQAALWRDQLLFTLRSDWTLQGTTHKAGSLLAADLDAWMAGDRTLATLFVPTERSSLDAMTSTRKSLVLSVLDNVHHRGVHVTRKGKGWRQTPLEGLPTLGTLAFSAVDHRRSDDLFITATSYLEPTRLLHGDKRGVDVLKSLPAFFDAKGLTVSQHEATSADGTRIPYFEVKRADLPADGSHPTLLYGYGGFEVALTPSYSATLGATWMERGGVYVVANLRGGGEFGPSWHQAALREKRPRAYEDFEAVAEDLIRRGITSPKHLGIMGGSNGGLLVGNALVRRPDLYGAVVCQVPLLDMKRYSHLLAGASWIGEYGDPDVPEDWAFLQGFSPYHQVKSDVAYPPVLMMTSTRDDRVHPGHARKMAARMLDWGHKVDYWENIEGGHGGAANNAQTAKKTALSTGWLWGHLSAP